MKNVLFTTTALVGLAVSGAAFAAAHGDNFTLTGETVVGYNDDIEGGIFQETNIDIKASRDAGNGFVVGGHVRLNLDWSEGGTEIDSGVNEVEFKSIYVETPIGKLSYTDSSDGDSASDIWYADRDGMTVDVQNLDGLGSLRWEGDLGDFGYAIDTGDISNAVSDDWSIGAGGTFGSVSVGVGYDNNSSNSGSAVTAVSADFAAGPAKIGVSYAANDTVTSIGVAASAEVAAGLTVGAYFATNDDADGDDYGVTLDYANGPFTLAFDYDTGEAGPDNFEVDVSFAVNDMVTIYAGYDDLDNGGSGAFYAGAEIAVADGITATIAYAEDDEIGGPEFKDGTSAFLTLTY